MPHDTTECAPGASAPPAVASPLAAATHALTRGWAPLPIPTGTKAPRRRDWTELRYESAADLAEEFAEGNIGLILGAASGGLVDVDLDCPEAASLAGSLLPMTPMRHGRPSAPESHYWYVVDREVRTAQYDDPVVREEIKHRQRQGLPPDPDLKARLVELRSTGGQTVIPPSTHPSGDVLAWSGGDEPGEPRAVAAEQLHLRVAILAAATLLARYWPASGLRHDASLALAGGLLRSGWSERNASHLVLAVSAAVDPQVDRADRTAAVASTAERLGQGLETRGWRSLADAMGRVVVDQVREWLDLTNDDADEPEESPDEIRGKVDLGALVAEGVPDPEWVLPGMFYRGQIHWWHGEPGDGKTFLLLGLMYRLAEEGRSVLWLDEESGKVQTARRLQSYGADPSVLTERFHYHARPGLTLDPADLNALFLTVQEVQPDVVVMDSVSDMLGQAGLDEDSNNDVTAWAKQLLEPLKFEYGAAVVAIDHVTKSKDSRGKYARGAGAKKSKTDAAWKVVKKKDFGVERVGIIRLEADKDRDGWLEPALAFRIGGRGGRTVLEPMEAVAAGGNKLPEGEVEQRVVEFLRLNADCPDDAVPGRDVEAAVQGKGVAIRDALRDLAKDHATGVRCIERGRTQRWWFEDLSESIELDFRSVGDE